MKKPRQYKKIILLITTIFVTTLNLVLPVTSINAFDAVLQEPDILTVTEPVANSKVKGTINIVWKMYDNDQNVIPYSANLYDAQTCNVTNYGKLNSNPNGNSSLTQNNILSWNTRTTLTNSNIPDGNYCLKICAALKNGNVPYSACNGRNITIINNNRLPSITSIPTKLTFYENESWSYQVRATDPDGDTLNYRFVVKPAFLDINPQTGLITSNNVNKNPGANDTVKYNVVIAVDDNFSGSVTQQFELTIKKVFTGGVTPPPSQTPTPPPAPVNDPTIISITSPLGGDLVNQEVIIKWNIKDENGIKEISIEYSKDSQNWTNLITSQDPNLNEYKWDITEVEDGEYFIRIKAVDSLDTETSKVSGKFIIENETEVEEPIESVPLIINTSPVNNSEIENKFPDISGEFVPSDNSAIDPTTFKMFLDEIEITEQCTADEIGFSCRITSELADGNHKVRVSIKDTSGKTAISEWTFSILPKVTPESYPADLITIFGWNISSGTLALVIIICTIVFLLITIPWILYILWTRKNRTSVEPTDINKEINISTQPQEIGNGYYLPPYNPIPSETTVHQTDPLEAYNKSLNEQFPIQPQPMEQAEPKIEFKSEEVEPVLPSTSEEGNTLAKVEPKISNEQSEEVPNQEYQPPLNEKFDKEESDKQQIITPSYTPPQPIIDTEIKSDTGKSMESTNGEEEFVEPTPVD